MTVYDVKYFKNADVFDTRDLIQALEDLEDSDDLDEQLERAQLVELANVLSDYAEDYKYGATVVADSYFEEYARQLAEDCGMIDRDVSWPQTCIDWAQAARELQSDYTAIEWMGLTYWTR